MNKSVAIQQGPLPAGLAPGDRAATRAWLVEAAEQEVVRTGALAPAMRVLLPDGQQLVETPFAESESEAAVAVFQRLIATPGAIRGYRAGELAVAGRRVAAVLEVEPGSGAWAAWRAFAVVDGGIGVWLDEAWRTLDGTEPELSAWLNNGGRIATSGGDGLSSASPSGTDVRVASARLQAPAPGDAEGVARLVGAMLDGEIAAKGLAHTLVVAFRGAEFDLWQLRAPPPGTLDEVVRAIAGRSRATAVALVTGVVTELYGQPRRAITTVAEAGGRRFERAVPLTFDDSGGAFPLPALGRWHGDGELPPDARWIEPSASAPPAIRESG